MTKPSITVETDSGFETYTIDVNSARLTDQGVISVTGHNAVGEAVTLVYQTDDSVNPTQMSFEDIRITGTSQNTIQFAIDDIYVGTLSDVQKQ